MEILLQSGGVDHNDRHRKCNLDACMRISRSLALPSEHVSGSGPVLHRDVFAPASLCLSDRLNGYCFSNNLFTVLSGQGTSAVNDFK